MTEFSSVLRREFLGAGGALMGFAKGVATPSAEAAAALYGNRPERGAAAVKQVLQQKDIPSLS